MARIAFGPGFRTTMVSRPVITPVAGSNRASIE